MRKLLVLCLALAAAGWLLSAPSSFSRDELIAAEPDPVAGERIFWAGGCASCHTSAQAADSDPANGPALLGGGQEFDTPYGIFRAPNISTHKVDGIGGWSTLEFVNAMQRGVSPAGKHYYPAFPYTSYARMAMQDVVNLKAYMDTLPAVSGQIADHSLSFPWNIRRGIGLWKRRYLSPAPVIPSDPAEPQIERGRALVEGPGHCGECHTARDPLGGLKADQWLAGAPDPEGRGRIPNITPASKSIGAWSVDDLAYYFESGFTPDYDTTGGTMVEVQENLARLSSEDRLAIAHYLKSIPAVPSGSK